MMAARLSPGAISESSSSHLPPSEAFAGGKAGGISTRAVEPRNDAAGDGVGPHCKDDRDRPGLPLDGNGRSGPDCQNDVGLQADQLLRKRSYPIDVIAAPPKVHPHVAAIAPTQVRKRLGERGEAKLPLRIGF